ncbi:MAG: HAD-IIA family hydrolase [Bacillota bacterium]
MIIDKYKAFIFDLDGTIYLGEKLIPGAKEVITAIRSQNKPYLFLTNKPIDTRANYAKKLNRLGIATTEDNIINSSFVTAKYLKKHAPDSTSYIVGEKPLRDELEKFGLTVTESIEDVDYLIASFDRTFTYQKLDDSLQIIKQGARFIATNPDRTCPVDGGEIPDAAGMIGAIEGTTGKKVEKIMGKPSQEMLEISLDVLGMNEADKENCLIIGDRLETDIHMGQQFGLDTALVLSGVTQKSQIKPHNRPTHVLGSVNNLLT